MSPRRRALAPSLVLAVLAALALGVVVGTFLGGSPSPSPAGHPTSPKPAGRAAGSTDAGSTSSAGRAGSGHSMEDHAGHAGEGRAAAAPAEEDAAGTVWTCAMHPQIRLEEPGPCPICGMDLIPLETGGGEDFDPSIYRMSEAARTLARVRTAPVERRPVTRAVSMVGKVDYDETRVETISARFAGRLDRLFVDYTGVPVKEGDHLASIYSPELLSAQQELLQALRAAEDVGSEARFLRETTRATIEASREKLRLWGLKPEQIARIERSGKVSDHLTLYAHQSGIVVRKHANEGDYVQEGSKIYTIADLEHLWVKFDAYESDLAWIRYGQEAEFETEAYPGEVFAGRISFIDPVLDERTRTVDVRVNVENPRGRLKPGMFVRGRVHAELMGSGTVFDRELAGKWISPMHPEVVQDEPGTCSVCGMPLVPAETLGFVSTTPEKGLPLVVPATAALLTGKRALVYVEVPGAETPTYEGRVVELGPRAGDVYIVRSGVEEGERVVVQGNFKIDSAVQIQAGASMMTLPSEEARDPRDLHGSTFLAALRALTGDLGAIAAALTSGDADAGSAGFAALRPRVEALPLDGLEGRARRYAEELRERMLDAVDLGADAWERPEQRKAFLRLGRALEEAWSRRPELSEGERGLLLQVKALALSLAEALAEDDAAAARELLDASPVPGEVPPDAESRGALAVTRWRLTLILQALREAQGLDRLREHYAVLSDLLVALTRRVPTLEAGARVLSCPMAFGGRGARWLQSEGPVANPYFGAAMLRCGEPFDLGVEGP